MVGEPPMQLRPLSLCQWGASPCSVMLSHSASTNSSCSSRLSFRAWSRRDVLIYSPRIAVTGFTAVARRAGT